MKRKKLVALTACLLLGAALLVGCGEEEPAVTNSTDTTAATPGQTQPEDPSLSTEQTEQGDTTPTQPEEIQPDETTPAQPDESRPDETTPAQPDESRPDETTPAQPDENQPEGTTPTQPDESRPDETTPTQPEEIQPDETTPTEPEETKPEQTKPGQEICSVETDYGELHFHVQWAPYMQIRQEKDDDTVRVFFLARLNGNDYPLFDLTISADPGQEGQLQLTDYEGQKHAVEVNMEASIDHGELDATGQEILYSMQEQVNFVIEFLE